jgi:hypothetical protein
MKRCLLGLIALINMGMVNAQVDAVRLAMEAGVFVGAAAACKATAVAARYEQRFEMILADIDLDKSVKEEAQRMFARVRSEARASQLHTPVTACEEVVRIVRDQPLLKDVNRRAQQRLKELGFDPGPVDGLWGPKSQAALRRYQETYELPVTGEVDRPTLTALDLDLAY